MKKLLLKYKFILFIITLVLIKMCLTVFFYFSSSIETKNIESPTKEQEIINDKTTVNTIFVDIEGSINKPGLYEIDSNLRLGDLVEKAGGFTHANTQCVNLSKKLSDEEYIYIPKKEEKCETQKSLSQNNQEKEDNNGKININTASASELETLNGIGSSRAQDIIEYRDANGKFTSKEDIQNVSGIGEATYNNIEKDIVI